MCLKLLAIQSLDTSTWRTFVCIMPCMQELPRKRSPAHRNGRDLTSALATAIINATDLLDPDQRQEDTFAAPSHGEVDADGKAVLPAHDVKSSRHHDRVAADNEQYDQDTGKVKPAVEAVASALFSAPSGHRHMLLGRELAQEAAAAEPAKRAQDIIEQVVQARPSSIWPTSLIREAHLLLRDCAHAFDVHM
jgi:hypothetical protein